MVKLSRVTLSLWKIKVTKNLWISPSDAGREFPMDFTLPLEDRFEAGVFLYTACFFDGEVIT